MSGHIETSPFVEPGKILRLPGSMFEDGRERYYVSPEDAPRVAEAMDAFRAERDRIRAQMEAVTELMERARTAALEAVGDT